MGTERSKAEIIARLQSDLLLLQGFRPSKSSQALNAGLGEIVNAFPQDTFPTGAVHEFISESSEDRAATTGFVSGILGHLMSGGASCMWIGRDQSVFPLALHFFGIPPERVIFVRCARDREVAWALEEALKCQSLSAVIGEIQELSFTLSRRLQLVTEQSAVTGILIRHLPRNIQSTACVSRWRIRPLASLSFEEGLPGVGFPRWDVTLEKVRNGRPGSWQVEWADVGLVVPQLGKTKELPRQKKIG